MKTLTGSRTALSRDKTAEQCPSPPQTLEATSRPSWSGCEPAALSAAVERGFSIGFVELEELDEAGNCLQHRLVQNTLSYAFRNEQAKWMSGQAALVPNYIALGTAQTASSINQKTVNVMTHEVIRAPASENAVLTDGTRFRGVYRANDCALDVKEAMLFAGDAVTSTVHACNSSSGWTTGSGQSLSVDTTERREGTGSLRVDTTGGGPADQCYNTTSLAVNLGLATTNLQLWYFVSTVSQLNSSTTFQLSSSTSVGSSQWAWTVTTGSLINGWNYLDLPFSTATITGTPDSTAIKRFTVTVTKTHPVTLRLDRIRTFTPSGTGLARVELPTPYQKQIGSVLNLTWTILPDYEKKANTFLWEGASASAIIADVTRNLTETGTGTFSAVTGHNWTYTTMWLPAASGYMSGGLQAFSTLKGGVCLWLRYAASGSSPANCILWDWRQDANNRITLKRDGTDAGFLLEYVRAASTKSVSVVSAFSANAYRFVVAQWDLTGISLSVNGAAPTTTAITSADLMTAITNVPTMGGGSGLTTTTCKLGPVLGMNRPLSTSEISTLYAINRFYRYAETTP